MNQRIFYVFLGFMLVVALIQALKKPALKLGLVDRPGGRKQHDGHVPLIGGVAMFLAFSFSALMLPLSLQPYRSFFAAIALLVVVGVLDDMHDISARSRIVAQIFAGIFMASWGGNYLENLGDLFGDGNIDLGDWAIPFTIFGVVGVINALNMSDGLDGLAGGLSAMGLSCLAGIAFLIGAKEQATLLLLLLSVVAGFLVFNFRHPWRSRASVFMGDAGSMMLGFCFVWFAVDLSQSKGPAMTPVTALWVLALPLMDTVCIMIRRMLKGRSPFVADREHLHHILLLAGYSPAQTVWIMLAISALLGAIGLAGWYFRVPEYVMFYAFIALFLAYSFLMRHAWKVMKAIKHFHEGHKQPAAGEPQADQRA